MKSRIRGNLLAVKVLAVEFVVAREFQFVLDAMDQPLAKDSILNRNVSINTNIMKLFLFITSAASPTCLLMPNGLIDIMICTFLH